MNISCELSTQNLKDYFFIFGIFSTCIMSFITILITLKNRRNALRESLYKEQLIFSSTLTTELYKLHSILTRLNHKYDSEKIINVMFQVEAIFGVIFSNSHIGSNNILLETSNTLDSVNNIIDNLKNQESINLNYQEYLKKYQKLINTIRSELGVISLIKENENLFKN